MSGYKDFANYNQACENIRPTARIQLVQRILNAASLISSLGQGVPLRWANAYKSFQVLVPNENSAPTDYTTDEAISSCDSILHEAESQLRAASEDLNTLKTELTGVEMDNVGVNMMIYLPENMHVIDNLYVKLIDVSDSVKGSGVFGFHFNTQLHQLEWFWCSNSAWANLEDKLDVFDWAVHYLEYDNYCFQYVNSSSQFGLIRSGIFCYTGQYDDKRHTLTVTATSRGSGSMFISCFSDNTASNFDILNSAFYADNPKQYALPDESNARQVGDVTVYWGSLTSIPGGLTSGYISKAFETPGIINSEDYLGLPDATEVINILDNM